METTRQQKIGRLLQKELAEIFLRDLRSLAAGGMITITKAYVTKDLSIARVYISIFGTPDPPATLESIKARGKDIRTLLAHRVRLQLRIIPAIEFYLDDSLDYIEKIERILKQ